MKTAVIILLAISISISAACLPVNFARSSKDNAAADSAETERRITSGEIRAENAQTFNINEKPEATPKPKTKKAAAADNFVCVEPALPCQHRQKQFEDWELSFRLPAQIVPNRVYESAPFYAVILKKYDDGCADLDINEPVEAERRRIQKLFPSRKVFAEYSCPNLSAVGYDFAGKLDKTGETLLYMDYIAVYAGVDAAEGREIFDLVREHYPQAELKKMTAAYSRIEQ